MWGALYILEFFGVLTSIYVVCVILHNTSETNNGIVDFPEKEISFFKGAPIYCLL